MIGSAYIPMGNVLVNLDRYEEAIAAFQRAASLDPDGDAGEYARKAIRFLRQR